MICIAIPLAVGGLSALITHDSMKSFEQLNQPSLSPPGWLFPAVWSVLYILMGLASYFVLNRGNGKKQIRVSLYLYTLQLIMNFFWSIIFFNLGWFLFAFVWLVVLLILIILTTVLFFRQTETAGYLMIPYILWVIFAGYLNFCIYLLN